VRYPRRLGIVVTLLAFALASTAFGPVGLGGGSDDPSPVTGHDVALARQVPGPTLRAAAYIVVDEQSGAVLFGRDQATRRPIASITKIMTALVVLDRARLGDVVTVQVDSASLGDSSVMGLAPGERLTVRDLLLGLLLPSGNDAAIALAQHVAGSEPAFVDLMNRRARELGLNDTSFANPHGLDAPKHYSSAADLASLTRVALRNPALGEIVATRSATVRGAKLTYQLRNTNPLLGRPGVEGVKTGQTDGAGPCLVAAVRRDGHRIVIVVLDSPDRAEESWRLVESAFSAYTWPRYVLPPDPFAGSAASSVRMERAPSVVPTWQDRHMAPVALQQPARVEFRLGDEVIALGADPPACRDARCP
jgi:D-alanyl-D-alanine carboxypeptidase (penicillin-binding protein 5/6)